MYARHFSHPYFSLAVRPRKIEVTGGEEHKKQDDQVVLDCKVNIAKLLFLPFTCAVPLLFHTNHRPTSIFQLNFIDLMYKLYGKRKRRSA